MRLLFLLFICLARIAFGEPDSVALDTSVDGVYSLYANEKIPADRRRQLFYFQTTILELKGGRFRYWFCSDLKSFAEPHYPVTGTYTAKGGTVTTEIKIGSIPGARGQPPRDVYKTEEWKAMKYHGQIILWPLKLLGPPVAGPPPHNVLVRTSRNPEEIWKQETKQEQ